MSATEIDADDCSASEGAGHVHFSATELPKHDAEIEVVPKQEGLDEVHLGFLKIQHIYEVTFLLKHKLGNDVTFDPLENLWVKVKNLTPTKDGHEVVVEFNASREKLMKEKISLRRVNSDDVLELIFHARILGKHKGTPSLRNGIRCVRVESDEDDETDWQGF